MRPDERIRVQRPLLICLGCRSKSKNRDKQLTFIVRVSGRIFFKALSRGDRLVKKQLKRLNNTIQFFPKLNSGLSLVL